MRNEVVCVLLVLCAVVVRGGAAYSATALRTGVHPVFGQTSGQSSFDWNYNAAAWTTGGAAGKRTLHLLIRTQNRASTTDPFATTPSRIAYVNGTLAADGAVEWNEALLPIGESAIVLEPSSSADNFGTEDPRITYEEGSGLYWLTYTAAQHYAENNTVVARLSLASSPVPRLKQSWQRHGAVFPSRSYSKSGALLPSLRLMIFGDSSLRPGLTLAVPREVGDPLQWRELPQLFLPVRKNSFDSHLTEAGPHPMRLSDGNLFFVYNSAQAGHPSKKPGYDLQYNVGWAVLNGTDPTHVLQRCTDPLLTPTLPWERDGLTPNVVFVEGMVSLGADEFLVVYGAADSVLGTAVVKVIV